MFQNTKLFIFTYLCVSLLAVYYVFNIKNKSDSAPALNSRNIISIVNNHPINISDYLLQKEKLAPYLDNDNEANKEYILNQLTDNMLLLHEAERLKLNQKKSFLEEIEYFWHQSLIGELLKVKSAEISKAVKVTDEEIEKYYQSLKNEYYFRYIEIKDLKHGVPLLNTIDFDNISDKTKGNIAYDSQYSWVNVQTIDSQFRDLLLNGSPTLNKWSFTNYNNTGYWYCFKEIREYKISDVKEIKEEIRNSILEEKQHNMLEAWMNDLRKNSKISINNDILKKL